MRPALRSLVVIAISLFALPLFAQTDVTGTWSGTYSAQWPGLGGCSPPITTSGTMTLVLAQTGSTVTGSATVSKTPSGGTCTAPVFSSATGNVNGSISSDDTLTLSAPNSATISASVSGNAMTGTLMNSDTQIFFSLTRNGSTPSGTGCNLSIAVQCTGSNCSSTTRNDGTTACSGDYFVGFLSTLPPSQLTFSGFNSGLGLTDCFDTTMIPDSEEAFVMCYGTTSLPAGGSFTTSTKVSGTAGSAASLPILGFTYVADSADSSDLALVYAFANATPATCDTRISVPPPLDSGLSYQVTWEATSAGPTAAYQLDEATDPNFTTITSSQTINGLSATFRHTVTTTTTYYYRVRAALCNGAPGPYATGSVKVIAKAIPTGPQNQYNGNTPVGSTEPVSIPIFVSAPAAKAGTLDTTTFTATSDKPYMSIVPSSGTIPPGGTTVTAVMNPTNLPPGANTGTVTVTPSVGPPQTAPVSVSLVTPVASGGKGLPPSNALIIPVVTHVTGAAGSYVSDVRLTNASNAAINYQVTFTPRQSDGTKTGQITNITVNALQTIALNDITKNFFGYGATSDPNDVGFGALEIRPLNTSSTATYASSRTYLDLPSGTFGQFIAAVPFSQFATALAAVPLPGAPPSPPPAPLSFQQIAESSKFYTNLGLVEGSGTPANGQIKIYDDAGTLVTPPIAYSLQPGEQKQLGHFLANHGVPNLEDGRIEITVDSPTGAVSGYASVLDTKTSDPLAVMPVQASLVKATRYVLPGVSEFTSPFSNFHSDVRLFNGGSTSANVTLTYYPQGNGTPVPLAPMTIGPGLVKAFDNVLPSLFNVTSGGGSIVATTPSTSSLVLTGRTFSRTATGGTYGQFIPGVTPANGSVGTGDKPLQILQLEQSAQFHSNVGLVETTGNPAHVKLTLVLPDSLASANIELDLAANEFRQLGTIIKQVDPTIGFNQASAVYNARVIVQVTGGSGRVAAYGSVIDDKTSDPTYVPAQ